MSTILGANPLGFVVNESSLLDLDSVMLSEESTYLSETLRFIQECNREFDEANKGWYKSILESGNDQEVITESFHSFFVKVKDIIDKFIAYIKSLAERFVTAIMSISKNDNYIKKHKDDLKKFVNSKDEFDYEGYKFTFDPNVPVCEVGAQFTQEFIELKMLGDEVLNADDIAVSMKTVYDNLIKKLENGFYDAFRKEVLNVSRDISQSDFANECFSVFRDNTSDKENITINAEYVNSAYLRFTNYSDMKKDVEGIKKRLVKEYEAVRKQILEISKSNYTGTTTTTDINLPGNQMTAVTLAAESAKYLDLYIKAKSDQVQEMSNIHAIAFACKLDAMKAAFVQDKTILYKALSKCQRVHNEANYTDYTKEFEYASFLMESLENQKSMERYIKECCIISEGVDVYERIHALNEGVIGDKFKKFVDWIKGLIAKFIEKLTGLFAKDKTYLEKYKNIILGKKFKETTFSMPDYFTGIQRIVKTGVPQFNYMSQEKLLAGENGEFAKSIIQEYNPANYDSFSAFCKEYFQGSKENKDYTGAQIGANIKDIYDFCYDYKKIEDQIKKDQNTILSGAKKAEDVLVKASKENEANRTQAANTNQTQDNAAKQESITYSAVYDRFFTEADDEKPGLDIKAPENKPEETSNNNDKSAKANLNNISDKGTEVKNDSDEAKANAAGQEVKQITENTKRYTDVCGSLLTAKLTIIEKIRADFMKIIRYHVQSYVGTKDDRGDNRGADAAGSDYRSDEKRQQSQDSSDNTEKSGDAGEKKKGLIDKVKDALPGKTKATKQAVK